MGQSLWTFRGYVTDAGAKVVQRWFFDILDIDERDLIRDRVNRLKDIERHLWVKPGFAPVGEGLFEIRRDTQAGWLRIYGFFPADRHHFVVLAGNDKQAKNDKTGKNLAKQRWKLLKQGIGGTHGFDFEEEFSTED
jgi:putative component of toxin-antitoxin plasmid stabilization module